MKLTKSLFVGILLSAVLAEAKSLNLTLVQKIQGPAVFVCAPQMVLDRTSTEISAVGTVDGSDIEITNLNKGTVCRKLNSSFIFGGVKCTNSYLHESFSAAFAEERSCTNEMGGSVCDPMKGDVSKFISIDKAKKKVLLRQHVGWEGEEYFTCEYKY